MNTRPLSIPAWRASDLADSAGLSVEDAAERLEHMVARGDLCRLECGTGEAFYAHLRPKRART